MGLLDDLVNPTRADLDAIYAFVRAQRPAASSNPEALKQIESFEGWYQGLGLTDALLDNETLKEAKRRKAALLVAMKQTLPADYVPADAPQTPPPRDETLDAMKAGLSDTAGQAVSLVKVAAIAAVGIVLLNLYQGTKLRR